MASVSTACLLWINPENIGMKQSEMLKAAITALFPQGDAAARANLTFFIDHGYLEIVKNQNKDNVTNLIQIMLRMGVKFLGTLKNTEASPFHIEDFNNKHETNLNHKVIGQSFGTRSLFESKTRIRDQYKMKVVVVRHGLGRLQCVRLGTNMPMLIHNNFWIFETSSGCKGSGQVLQREHVQKNLHIISSTKSDETNSAWSTLMGSIYKMTQKQQTQDWFLSRMFCFTSTTFHCIVNMRSALFIDDVAFQILHVKCKIIAQLYPTTDITLKNAATYEDADLQECHKSYDLHSTTNSIQKNIKNESYYKQIQQNRINSICFRTIRYYH